MLVVEKSLRSNPRSVAGIRLPALLVLFLSIRSTHVPHERVASNHWGILVFSNRNELCTPQVARAFEVNPNILQTTVPGLKCILLFDAKMGALLPE